MNRHAALVVVMLISLLFSAHEAAAAVSAEQHMQQGREAFRNGALVQAIGHWQQAETEYARQNRLYESGRALVQQAAAYQALGYYDKAVVRFDQARLLAVHPESRKKRLNGLVLAGLSHQCTLQTSMPSFSAERCKPERKNSYFRQGMALAKALGDTSLQAALLLHRGNWHAQQAITLQSRSKRQIERRNLRELARQMLEDYRQAIMLAEQNRNIELLGKAYNNITLNARRIKEVDSAKIRDLLLHALRYVTRMENSREKAFLLLNLGKLAQESDTSASPHSLFQQALKIARQLHDQRAQSLALGYLSNLYASRRQYKEARLLANQAIFAAGRTLQNQDLLMQWNRQIGHIAKAAGKDLDEVIKACKRALTHLEQLRRNIETCLPGSGYSFAETIQPLYLELADLLLRRAERPGPVTACKALPLRLCRPILPPATLPREQCDLRNVAELLERFKDRELQEYFQDACVTHRRCTTPLTELIDADSAAVYYVFLPDRAAALLYTAAGFWQIPLKNLDGWEEQADSLLTLIRTGSSSYLYQPAAEWLYEKLIEPLEAHIRPGTHLILITGDRLRNLPMAALRDKRDGKFLVEKHPLATVPGLMLTDTRGLAGIPNKLLLGGLAQEHVKYSKLPPLIFVSDELNAIDAQLGQDNKLLLNRAFTQTGLEDALHKERDYSIVHLATHTFFTPDSRDSIILTAPDKEKNQKASMNLDDLEQLVRGSQGQSVRLLVLSACATAADEEKAALGLAGIAVKAGAPSAIGTLWQISDQAGTVFMGRFYTLLAEALKQPRKISLAEVFRQTQLYFISGQAAENPELAEYEPKNPYYWAPFILIGNWHLETPKK
ncbi:MAG: CHAT domain-containing protein [Gammaproteobacteria bacterium]|nr:CHAT domain-containing protein [Gammaproteobacteria bacterium]